MCSEKWGPGNAPFTLAARFFQIICQTKENSYLQSDATGARSLGLRAVSKTAASAGLPELPSKALHSPRQSPPFACCSTAVFPVATSHDI